LCVDLDGTLVRTDMLHEAILDVIKHRPLAFLHSAVRLHHGKAMFKHRIADCARLDVTRLPFRSEVMQLIHDARAQGRTVVLATAAAPQIAHAIAQHLGVFDEVLCSNETCNLSSHIKANELVDRYGVGGFDYVGNHSDDLAVWRSARKVIAVSDSKRLLIAAARHGQEVQAISSSATGFDPLLRSMRPHQWLKNLLVFVPLIAGHQLGDATALLSAILAAVAFCLAASSVYIVNDLFDLSDDRAHRSKHKRPFAMGAVPIRTGAITAPLLLVAALAIATLLPYLFVLTLLFYMLLTAAYSFRLKRQVILDVVILAALYTIRVIGGATATEILPSFWLLAFSMFVFFSLAMVKRYTELLNKPPTSGALPGRGYVSEDQPVLLSLGVSSALISVLVLALYIASPQVIVNYREPLWLWILPSAMLYWSARLWMKTARGEVHDDPVVFAIRDRQSLAIVTLLTPVIIAAQLGWQPWL
jgi:4-hydroxybenzoate polyprenyltransferase